MPSPEERAKQLVTAYPLTFESFSDNEIELIAAVIREAVGAERERCAQIAETHDPGQPWGCVSTCCGPDIASRIRALD